ncbi:MAG: PilT/PilU family type 4a pilus ATPase [Thermoanaerobaculia bacterium]|nr:PilT/PilU family type 4a pilus ATPase [Thermoanaerobaculia bacterium]
MERLTPDPDLERLVQQLNQGAPAPPPFERVVTREEPVSVSSPTLGLDSGRRETVDSSGTLARLLAETVRRGASDLLLVRGLPPVVRIDGKLVWLSEEALDGAQIHGLFREHLGERGRRDFAERGAVDFSLRAPVGEGAGGGRRFRVNLHRQRGEAAAALRTLPREIPTLAGLHLPAALAELVRPARGLVLLCGPAGSGKTTTLAALVGELNRSRPCHIVTIEDPVEYEHRSQLAVIEHIEIGRDARSFSEALVAALRQDPEVLLVGEMRDLETISTALTAAETGHLVLATLHTNDAVQAVHRLVDVFPASQQSQVRQQLAVCLHAVVHQQLVPKADGRGRLPAVEILQATPPVRHLIRSEQLQKLYNELVLGQRHGMVTLESSLARLVREGQVTLEDAQIRSGRLDELAALLR